MTGPAGPAGPAGSRLLIEESHDLPLARATVTLRTGASEDPEGREGLACFASELARRGAAGIPRAELDAAFEGLGADLDVSADFDSVTFDVEVLSRNFERAVALLADVVLRPDLAPVEAEKLVRETHAALDELRDDDGALARRFFSRALFDQRHPYGHPIGGTDASIDRLDAASARRWLEQAVRGGDAIFGAAGDVDPGAVAALFRRRFGALRRDGVAGAAPTDPPHPSGKRLILVDKPERAQSHIVLGHPAPRWSDPDYLPLQVAATAFGGTFTARLMTEVRVKRGLSYGAYARVGQARGARALSASVYPEIERTGETLALVLDLWRDWVVNGLTDDEVAFARDHLAGAFGFRVATPEDRLDLDTAIDVCGLPADWRARHVTALRAITPSMVQGAMRRRLRAEDLIVTIVTTVRRARPQLAKAKLDFSSTEVVPFDSY